MRKLFYFACAREAKLGEPALDLWRRAKSNADSQANRAQARARSMRGNAFSAYIAETIGWKGHRVNAR